MGAKIQQEKRLNQKGKDLFSQTPKNIVSHKKRHMTSTIASARDVTLAEFPTPMVVVRGANRPAVPPTKRTGTAILSQVGAAEWKMSRSTLDAQSVRPRLTSPIQVWVQNGKFGYSVA